MWVVVVVVLLLMIVTAVMRDEREKLSERPSTDEREKKINNAV